MAENTALEIVQRVMSAIDSDEVTSINDTVESEQVFLLLKTVYDSLLDDFPWWHTRSRGQLEVTPTNHIMKIPDDVDQVIEPVIWYNGKKVHYKDSEEMVALLHGRDTSLSNVDSSGAITDRDPSYWTSYDDENIVFDSYNDSLASSLTDCAFKSAPADLVDDNSVPDLPEILRAVLLWGVMEEAFRTLKGDETAASKYENKYIKGLAKAKRWARKLNMKNGTYKQSYGRKSIRFSNEIDTNRIIEGS